MKEKNFQTLFPIEEAETQSRAPIRANLDWVENCVNFEKSTDKQVATPKSKMNLFSFFSQTHAFVYFLSIFLVFLLIVIRVLFLQIIQGEHYLALSEGNRQRLTPIPAERGHIYDRYLHPLTKNVPNFSLALTPQDLPRETEARKAIVERLSVLIKKNKNEIETTLEEYGNYSYESIIIEEGLDYEAALSIQIAGADLPGLFIYRGSKRKYLYTSAGEDQTEADELTAQSLSHVLGYLGKLNPDELKRLYQVGYVPSDSIGKTGVELQYEKEMRGTYGLKRVEVNALGHERAVLDEDPPVPGNHIILSLDVSMQAALESIVKDTLERTKKERAAVVVMDPRNSEILSLISWPTFDNNDFSGGIDEASYGQYIGNKNKPLFQRAISGTYPSGSTIKPALAASALEENIITPETTFFSKGGIQVGPWFFPDWQAGGHGLTNVRKSLAQSVNTFYYFIGGGFQDFVGLGVDRITAYLRRFGFAEQLNIDLPHEASGFLPSREWKEANKKERWYIGDTYNMSIGQGDILVTPLQIAAMTSTIANNGTLHQPHIVTGIIDAITEEKKLISYTPIRENIIASEHLNTVRLGMKDCVDYGSCRKLSTLPFDAAGKTGTAQWSKTKENHSWFTSFAPFNDPRIVVTVIVEEGGEGSDVAVPIAQALYAWWWKNRQI